MGFGDLLAVADRALRDSSVSDSIVYTPSIGEAVTVAGCFDALHTRVDLGQPGVTSQGPACWLDLGDLPSDPETDTDAQVTFDGQAYTIHEVQKDGKGGVMLLLHTV